ncbi:MAG: hypothetical protein EZS28_034304, partial [Streblomastix strix]
SMPKDSDRATTAEAQK